MPKDVLPTVLKCDRFAESMARDLQGCGLFSTERSCILRFVKFFTAPISGVITPEYVDAVKAWRLLVIGGFLTPSIPGYTTLWRLISPFGVVSRKPSMSGQNYMRLDDDDSVSIQRLHFVILCCWKIQWPSEEAPWSDFITRVSKSGKPTLDRAVKRLVAAELARMPTPSSWRELQGRNGPGAVSEGLKSNEKWDFFLCRKPWRVPSNFYYVNPRLGLEHESSPFGETRALQVPKDARGPRFISCEPLLYQHAAFAVSDWISEHMHKLYPRNVSLDDQFRHCLPMRSADWCTIDLSNASDMLNWNLVAELVPDGLLSYLVAVRSQYMNAGGVRVKLGVAFPMGSSLCFTVMTWFIIAALHALGIPFWAYRVYGDDIIVHRRYYLLALEALEGLGFEANLLKCCGPFSRFREACGQEWFWTTDRTKRINFRPVYIRSNQANQSAMLGLIQKAIEFAVCGFYHTGANIIMEVAAGDGSVVRLLNKPQARYNASLQRSETYVPKFKTRTLGRVPDDERGFYKWFVQPGKPETRTSKDGTWRTAIQFFKTGTTTISYKNEVVDEWDSFQAAQRMLIAAQGDPERLAEALSVWAANYAFECSRRLTELLPTRFDLENWTHVLR